MSWQAYVDTQLIGTKAVSEGAIYGLEGGQWAASPGFQIDPDQVTKVINGFETPTPLMTGGLTVSGVKYTYIYSNEKKMYLKKFATGIFAMKTNRAVIFGVHTEKQVPEPASLVVENLCDYLTSNGY